MDDLLDVLKGLRSDPARVIDLYRLLYEASLLAFVQRGTESSLESHSFLTYPTPDATRELPLFTRREYVLDDLASYASIVEVEGPRLWPRMLDIVETGKCEVAIDPGRSHGIRLTREMILGMTATYRPAP
jgi:hypothetical protein